MSSKCSKFRISLLSYRYNIYKVRMEFQKLFDILVHPTGHWLNMQWFWTWKPLAPTTKIQIFDQIPKFWPNSTFWSPNLKAKKGRFPFWESQRSGKEGGGWVGRLVKPVGTKSQLWPIFLKAPLMKDTMTDQWCDDRVSLHSSQSLQKANWDWSYHNHVLKSLWLEH